MPSTLQPFFLSRFTKKFLPLAILLLTIFGSANAQLNGSYQIGGVGAAFSTIKKAADSLNIVGVSGPVVFKIAPGTYTESIRLYQVHGVSPANNIQFMPMGDSTSVTIRGSSDVPDGLGYHFIVVDSTSDVTFTHLNFETTGQKNVVFRLIEQTDRVKFINNTFTSTAFVNGNTAGDQYSLIYFASGGTFTDVLIQGNVFNQGSYAIASVAQTSSLIIVNNRFNDQGQTALVVPFRSTSLKIRNNKISSARMVSGAQIFSAGGAFEFSGNTIVGDFDRGLDIENSGFSQTDDLRIFNNMIAGDVSSINGLVSIGNRRIKYYYNSVNIFSTQTSSSAFSTNADSVVSIVNNNFVNSGAGAALEIKALPVLSTVDYNNYWTKGSNLFIVPGGQAMADLPSFQTAFNSDAHSTVIDPTFISKNDLHALNTTLKGKATPIAGITKDIDNETRNASTPDAGADELVIYAVDASLQALDTQPLFYCGTHSEAFGVKITNDGTSAITSLRIDWSVNGTAQPFKTYTGNIAPGASVNYYFTGQTFPVDQAQQITVNISQVNGVADSRPYDNALTRKFTLRNAVALGNDIETCNVTADLASPAGYSTYSWTLDGTFVSSASSLTASATGLYKLSVADANNCVSKDSVNVLIHYVTPGINITKSPFLCGGDTIHLVASPVGAMYQYQWQLNGADIADSVRNRFVARESGNYTVQVKVATCEYISGSVTVSVTPAIPISIQTSGAFATCTGKSIVLEASPANDDVYSYVWRKDTEVLPGLQSSQLSVTQAGNYTVTISRALCSYTSDPVHVDVFASPDAVITIHGNTLSTAAGADHYKWYRDGEVVADGSQNSILATASGNYTVDITAGICTTTSAETPFVVTGLNEDPFGGIAIYPNPTTRRVTVQGLSNSASLKLEDGTGKSLAIPTTIVSGNDATLDFYGMSAGMYFLRIKDGSHNTVRKIVLID